jgi:membrane glycosyltransferase
MTRARKPHRPAPDLSAPAAPPLVRRPMRAQPWGALNPLVWLFRNDRGPQPLAGRRPAGLLRRLTLLLLSLAPALYATYLMSGLLPGTQMDWTQRGLLALFALLSCWVAAGFWTALFGFWVLLRGGDRHLISRAAATVPAEIPAEARTAIVMPICNEDVQRVFAGLRATGESLARTGQAARFDFFVLSDSDDPATCVAEADAWQALRAQWAADGVELALYYRRRLRRVKRKSGNIDDFCRRWGVNYHYMVVLDADSVMSGDCLTTLVRLMQARPEAGIIQTAPQAVGRLTLHARAQQFANQVYGPLFTAGLHFWQLSESHYWGHNAIIRVAPFMAHCALAPLPGRGSLAGEILSHDFVEAALMRRAGYGVWIAYDLPGSYEQAPSNLLEELQRDRRWCHGNLMNARVMFAAGIHPVHRAVFLTGALAYLSAPLWLGFLILSTWVLVRHASVGPQYFTVPHQLFPLWPSWRPEHAVGLVSAMLLLLFLPKLLGALLAAVRNPRGYGGGFNLLRSLLAEMLLSALLAPVRMIFHTRFVFAALAGWKIEWKSPARTDDGTAWATALRRHGGQALLGAGWLALVLWQAPQFAPWLAPVAGGLLLAAPLSVLTSRVSLGRRARRSGWFVTPAELKPPTEVAATAEYAAHARHLPRLADAVSEAPLHALLRALARRRSGPLHAQARAARIDRALRHGPEALAAGDLRAVLADATALGLLRSAVLKGPTHRNWFTLPPPAPRLKIHRPRPPLAAAEELAPQRQ